MNKIVIIGFPGSGKSTIGRRLASRLSYSFFDTDSYIEEKYRLSVSDFFSKYGENVFRICEYAVLRELLAKQNCVIATGGGLPCFFDSMQLINNDSLSIYLKLSVKSLTHRLLQSNKPRPLLQSFDDEASLAAYVQRTLISRENFYQQALLTVKGESIDVCDLMSLISPHVDVR